MTNEIFNQVLQSIRNNVDQFIATGDQNFLVGNLQLWVTLRDSGRAGEASEIFQVEALEEMKLATERTSFND